MSDSRKTRTRVKKIAATAILVLGCAGAVGAVGPVSFDDDPAVSIYRDFDDGLYGRSLYRGVVFSAKLESFNRYRSLPVRDIDGLTAYLLSDETARSLVEGRVPGITVTGRVKDASPESGEEPAGSTYLFSRDGIEIEFSLERVPAAMIDEIDRTYSNNPDVAEQVKESYRAGWVIRIHSAENVYRPGVARIDYEDILISASLLGEEFQPLWGIHDGNALLDDR